MTDETDDTAGDGTRGGDGEPAVESATADRDEAATESAPADADDTAGDSATHSPADTALLVDDMLGKLATYLRMCGYDATYTTERGVETEADALAMAHTEGRLVLTRDRGLAERAERSVSLTSRDVTDQLRELRAAGFELSLAEEPVRCSACNGLLEGVDRTEPTPDYAPDPHDEAVWRCRDCGQHFWRGSHWDDVAETLATL